MTVKELIAELEKYDLDNPEVKVHYYGGDTLETEGMGYEALDRIESIKYDKINNILILELEVN